MLPSVNRVGWIAVLLLVLPHLCQPSAISPCASRAGRNGACKDPHRILRGQMRMSLRGGMDMGLKDAFRHGSPSPMAIRRIKGEIAALEKDPVTFFRARPLPGDLLDWHFVLLGGNGTNFEGGMYHGRIMLDNEYPMKPPRIFFYTESGRFETGVAICLSMTSHHEETWQPTWDVRTAITALQGFMETFYEGAVGGMDMHPDDQKYLARLSRALPSEIPALKRDAGGEYKKQLEHHRDLHRELCEANGIPIIEVRVRRSAWGRALPGVRTISNLLSPGYLASWVLQRVALALLMLASWLGKVSVDLSVVPGAIPKTALAQGSTPAPDAQGAASTATTPFRQLSPEEEEAKSKEDKLELDLAVMMRTARLEEELAAAKVAKETRTARMEEEMSMAKVQREEAERRVDELEDEVRVSGEHIGKLLELLAEAQTMLEARNAVPPSVPGDIQQAYSATPPPVGAAEAAKREIVYDEDLPMWGSPPTQSQSSPEHGHLSHSSQEYTGHPSSDGGVALAGQGSEGTEATTSEEVEVMLRQLSMAGMGDEMLEKFRALAKRGKEVTGEELVAAGLDREVLEKFGMLGEGEEARERIQQMVDKHGGEQPLPGVYGDAGDEGGQGGGHGDVGVVEEVVGTSPRSPSPEDSSSRAVEALETAAQGQGLGSHTSRAE